MIIQPATVLEAIKARPGNLAVRPVPARRPALTARALASEIYGRGGRKPSARSNR